MSAAGSATYDTNRWLHGNHNHSIPTTSGSMEYDVTGDASEGITTGAGDFAQQGWNGSVFDPMGDTNFYPPLLNTHLNNQNIAPASTGFGNSSLHPVTNLTPSTAHDTFSPSEYASDVAVFGDAFSDYSTPGFDHTFSDHHPSQFIQTIGSPNLLSSPEMTQTSSISHSMTVANNPIGTLNSTTTRMHDTSASQFGSDEAATKSKASQPKLVVTIDEYKDEGPDENTAHQQVHRRNSSKAHLSPYPDEESSDEEDPESQLIQETVAVVSAPQPVTSAALDNHVRMGVGPEGRATINSEEMPSLDDLEMQHRLEEKNADVQDWLTHNETGSTGDDNAQSFARRSKASSRPRAKSTNDSPHTGHSAQGSKVDHELHDSPGLPGPGLTINVPSEMDDEDDYEEESEVESPPAAIALNDGREDYFSIRDSSNGTQHGPNGSIDRLKSVDDLDKAVAGITANMAIMRFRQRAKDTDSASVTATLGSRRMSESDIGSVRGVAAISTLLLSPPQQTARNPVRRKNSFLGNILPSRNNSNSNKLKRKNSHPVEQAENAGAGATSSPKDTQGGFAAPMRKSSFGRPKSPKVDTSVPSAASDARSPKAVASAASGAIRQIWRTRSRSDLGKSSKLGLVELMTQHGGPPMPTLASPAQNRVEPATQTKQAADEDSGDDDIGASGDGLTMDLAVRTDMHIIPTYDGFKYQARELNPRLANFLLERVTQEQIKRYKRLADLKTKHANTTSTGMCSSKSFCFASGGQSQELPPRPGNKDSDNALVGFQIMRPGMTEDDLEVRSDGQQMVAAQFPSGVPLPPVTCLPAEFECPLCFKVKKFYKPSDWTKHVHEDVQPFTCTFQNCNEPKSFKRKADWVRHENERHRQLEYWVCSVQECSHTCYRKDNFVQHLVREHKVPEPKLRTGRAGVSKSPLTPLEGSQNWQNQSGFANEVVEDVWALVEKCHKDSTKQPKDEPCKFCGNICTSWKKLTVHLAKHMEQISMPVLTLVEQRRTTIGYMNQRTQNMPQPMPVSTKPMNELPIFLCDEPMPFETEPQSMLGVDPNITTGMMHSYPPMNMAVPAQMAVTHGGLTASALSMTGGSYPPPSHQSRSRGSSFNEQDFSQQGTTYPPAGMHSRTMSSSTPPHFEHNANTAMFLQQPTGMYMQEPMPGANVYLTPASNTPVSLGYSPEGSTHSLHQTYGFHG